MTISSAAQIASYFIITPFILFYLLKDDHQIYTNIINIAPTTYKKEVTRILNDIDNTLFSFISGQLLVSAIVATLIFIGYWIIGLQNAFLLALFVFVFNFIPFCGPFIATIPALFIGLAQSPFMGIKVILVVIIVHLLDLNLISPRVVGQKLQIHPVTIILLLVVSFPIAGLIGPFIVIPLYAALKVILQDVYAIKFEKSST